MADDEGRNAEFREEEHERYEPQRTRGHCVKLVVVVQFRNETCTVELRHIKEHAGAAL